MDPSELRKLDRLYELYGYRKEKDEPTAKVYVLEQGMYYAAEIVNIKGGNLAKKFFSDYSKIGYACKSRDFIGIEESKEELFSGFFTLSASYKKLHNRYDTFAEKQVRHLEEGTTYEYVKAPYSVISDSPFSKSGDLISDVFTILNKTGPGLIIIEAAAGFGKTCTAYEILKNLIDKYPGKRPLFAELSKDRTARIFKHVLLTEIDEEYKRMVSSDLVRYHIKSGRIPFIIDGFDELLSKEIDLKKNDTVEEFEEIEPMLTTIGELLKGNAKIILTSRRTAIFSGDKFDKWRESYPKGLEVFRIGIETPRIADWLDDEKLKFVEKNNKLIKNISNPVLLSLLKFADFSVFTELIAQPEKIIDKYFNTLLVREQERQNLAILPTDQLSIFQKLAGIFTEYNINSEERAFLKDFFREYNQEIIDASLENYPPSGEKPTIDEIIDILTNHALLDRIGKNSDRIGFLNDFVFGLLIGENLINNNYHIDPKSFPESKAELALSAWKFKGEEKKVELWNIFEENPFSFSGLFRLSLDSNLRDEILHSFSEEQFESFEFFNVKFTPNIKFNKCVFINCQFESCNLEFSEFWGCSFINCSFYDCQLVNAEALTSLNISFYSCTHHDTEGLDLVIEKLNQNIDEAQDSNIEDATDMEEELLSLMFKIGGLKPKWKSVKSLLNDLKSYPQKEVLKVIQGLLAEQILEELGNGVKLTMEGIVYCNRKYKSKIK